MDDSPDDYHIQVIPIYIKVPEGHPSFGLPSFPDE